MNGPYVRRMILKLGDPDRKVPVAETFHEQTDDELTKKEVKQMEADDQAIQIILIGLPEDIYVPVDSCETAQEIWLRVQQMIKVLIWGFKTKRLSCLMNGKALLLPMGNRLSLAIIARVNELRAERLARAHDALALMANSNNPYNYPMFHQDQPSLITYIKQPQPNKNFIPQPSFNMNYMQQPMPNPKDITYPTTVMNMTLVLMVKSFKLNYSTPTNNNQRISSNPRNRQIAQPGMNLGQDRQMQMVGVQNVGNPVVQNAAQNPGVQNVGNQIGLIVVLGIANPNANQIGNSNVVAAPAEGNGNGNNGNQISCYNCRGLGHYARNCIVMPRRRDAAYLQTHLLIAQKEEAGIQLQAEEFDLMAATWDLEEIEEVNANCILMANLQQASTSGTQTDKAPVYDLDGIVENDSNVISAVSNMEQSGGTIEQHSATVEETRTLYDSLYNNLAIEVEKVNTVNHKLKEINVELTIELARYKNQEKCFEISKEKYDKLERCYQKFVYQEQRLTKKINALHLCSTKTITTLNEEIANLNNQLSKEKLTVSSLQEEKKKLKSDFKIREDELLDKEIQLDNKIKELDNILIKTGQLIQTMHMLSPKPDSFYHTEQKNALDENFPIVNQVDARIQIFGIQFLKEAAKFVRDFKSLAREADESRAKHKALEFEIERLLRAVVSQDIMSIVQGNSVVDASNLQTELDQYKNDKILYDKAYNDMQQKIERLQAQLGDLKGKSKDTPCESDTLDSLSQKLENENVELEFQVLNYAKENAHLKTTYNNVFDSINVTQAQTKTIIDSLQNKLHDTIY
ncbi:retrovirus-related pol polyprotein from transposon TNT 1-94 [Tanacetum coccineum]|uniref:Retrovirus-related pol polyprotein from transposon TNT 1-94 n=1 Tax=Tanacetum coccineum TaxID=301880 RepID=A0ABQ5FK17_9ASTR